MKIGFKDFCNNIVEAAGDKRNDFCFSQTLMGYYADYRPKFPEKSSGDFLIAYDHFKGKITISANTAAIPIIKKYTSFQDLLCELSNME